MDCSPPSSATIMNGTPSQTLATIAVNTRPAVLEPRHRVEADRAAAAPLMTPKSPLNMNRQANALTNAGTAHGRISSTR